MEFAQHLLNYYRGERTEAALFAAFGFLLSVVSFAMWRTAEQNNLLKGMFYPIAILALLGVLLGGFGVYNNSKRLAVMPVAYQQTPAALVKQETERFEGRNGVNTWWIPLKILWALFLLTGLVSVFSTRSNFVQGIAIGLLVFGTVGFVIDGFAHHRAKIYTQALMKQNAS